MENAVKELTVVDFLGIIVPGSLLVLLFQKDYQVQSIWNSYFGDESVANTIILLVAGYLVGMLIHELGDILEKEIWKLDLLNPRRHAAKNVFLKVDSTYRAMDSAGWKAFHDACGAEKTKADEERRRKEQERQDAAAMPGENQNSQNKAATPGEEATGQNGTNKLHMDWNEFPSALVPAIILVCFGSALLVYPIFTCLWPMQRKKMPVFVVVAMLVIAPIIAFCSNCRKRGSGIETIYVSHDASIQTEVFSKGTAAKRQLFEGFYCVMRNLLLVIGITNVYALSMSIFGCSSTLTNVATLFYQDRTQTILYSIVVIGMICRYVHYARLKYKYAYEDYLCILQQQEKKPSNDTKRMILSIQYTEQSSEQAGLSQHTATGPESCTKKDNAGQHS